MDFLKKILLLAAVMLSFDSVQATHIVGGVLEYKHISGRTYEVTIRVFRDCTSPSGFDGDPSNPVVPFLQFGVFDGITNSNVISRNLTINSSNITQIPPPLNNPCLIIPPNICVEEGVYTATITLPLGDRPYYITYERCCRNGTINNIVTPGDQGITLTATIPRNDSFVNSSAVFTNFPPTIICNNAPIIFDHSATDADGDSLVYEICNPLHGATRANPSPPPGPGPYTQVPFAPPYTATNPIGGAPPLTIDPNTGVLTGTPTATGQFLVGICVKEYRNGQLINTTTRDIQFNIVNCNIPIVNFVPGQTNIDPATLIGDYALACNNFTVDFSMTGGSSYFWDFGDPSISNDTSNLQTTSYTYSDTGTYLVMGVAFDNAGCSDTAFTNVYVYPGINSDFEFEKDVCLDTAVQFIDSSSYEYGTINSWNWIFGDGASSSLQNPAHLFAGAGNYNVQLAIGSDRGCRDTVRKALSIFGIPDPQLTFDPLCAETPISFSATDTLNLVSFDWDFSTGDTSSQPAPTTVFPLAGNYTVQLITVTDRFCRDTLTQNLTVNPLPDPDAHGDTMVCPGFSTQLTSRPGLVSYNWSPAASLNNATIPNPIASPSVNTTYVLQVTDANQCANTDTIQVEFFPTPIVWAGDDTSVCLDPSPFKFRDSVQLTAVNNGPTAFASFNWSPATGLNSTTIANPVSKPPGPVTYVVDVIDVNGCATSDSLRVSVLDPGLELIGAPDTVLCFGDSIRVNPIDQGVTGYEWTPKVFVSNDTIRNPYFFPPDTATYTLTVSNYCYTKSDSIELQVIPLPDLGTLSRLDSVCIGESMMLPALAPLPNVNYFWDNDPELDNPQQIAPIATPDTVGSSMYYLNAIDTVTGCNSRDSFELRAHPLPVPGIVIDRPDPYFNFVCAGAVLQLSGQGGLEYYWAGDSTNNVNPYTTILQDTSIITMRVLNIHACEALDSVEINVQTKPEISVPASFDACAGVQSQIAVGGDDYYSYRWFPDYRIISVNSRSPFFTPYVDTTYYVYATNDCFSSDTLSVTANVQPLPQPQIRATELRIFREQTTVLSVQDTFEDYEWSGWNSQTRWVNTDAFGSAEVEVEPFNNEVFRVLVTDEFGCENEDTIFIRVIPKTFIMVPTGFSPNGDGQNDLLSVLYTLNVDEIVSFRIFNRWGQEIIDLADPTTPDGWDGKFKGEAQPAATYVWQIHAIDLDGRDVYRNGTTTLLR